MLHSAFCILHSAFCILHSAFAAFAAFAAFVAFVAPLHRHPGFACGDTQRLWLFVLQPQPPAAAQP
ncbi:hypothetical protein D0A36_13685 [Xanthomonas campestris]|nr:hypothetical protein D0A36_13685 [Xanthomonas campestris]